MTAFSSVRSARILAAGLLLLLAACAGESSAPGPVGETGTALPPPTTEAAAAADQPASLPQPASTSQPPAAGVPSPDEESVEDSAGTGEPVIVKGPDGTEWQADKAKNEEAYQADIEDCYRYATAQTRRDAQIIDDRNAGIDTLTNQSRYAGLRQRVDEYDLRNRRASLMSSCMESKGYARADTVLPRLEF